MWYAPCKDGMLWSGQTLVRSLVGLGGHPWIGWTPLWGAAWETHASVNAPANHT